MFHDPEHRALRAMPAEAPPAPVAAAATQVDLSHYALPDQFAPPRLHHLTHKLVSRNAGETVIAALQFQIGIADAAAQQPDQRESLRRARPRNSFQRHAPIFYVNCNHRGSVYAAARYNGKSMPAQLVCFEPSCRARFAVTEVIYNCPRCGGLLETDYPDWQFEPAQLKTVWRTRRTCNLPPDQSGVWRYREIIPFLENLDSVVTLREGNTPLLAAPKAAEYGGLDRLVFKHQGFNPTGSFKDNGMTCGVAQARRLGIRRVACVSTGNTSASMAAYAGAAELEALIFIPHGNISYGKLAQALEYGARTFQVEANFDQILALVRVLAERQGIYLLNSINPFRIEGQKTIIVEMLDQRDWSTPDWIVLPGGNLGNTSAFGKALRELKQLGVIQTMPRLAVIQAEGAAPFFDLFQSTHRDRFNAVAHPETLATAIKIGDPVSWPKALKEVS